MVPSTGVAERVRKCTDGSVQSPHDRLHFMGSGNFSRIRCVANTTSAVERFRFGWRYDAAGWSWCRHAALSGATRAGPRASGSCNSRAQHRSHTRGEVISSRWILRTTFRAGGISRSRSYGRFPPAFSPALISCPNNQTVKFSNKIRDFIFGCTIGGGR